MNDYPDSFLFASRYFDAILSMNNPITNNVIQELFILDESKELLNQLKLNNAILSSLFPEQFINGIPDFFNFELRSITKVRLEKTPASTIICTESAALEFFESANFTKVIKDFGHKLIYLSKPNPREIGRTKTSNGYKNFIEFKKWKSVLTSRHHMGIKTDKVGSCKIEFL